MKLFLKRFRYSRKRTFLLLLLFIVISSITVGYSFVSRTLSIEGTTNLTKTTWDVHFNNIQIKSGSVTATTAPVITNDTTVSFAATLEDPGDFYEFNIDLVNAGTVDAQIDSITMSPTLTTAQQEYFDYTVTYSDGISISENHLLSANSTETLTVRFLYKVNEDATKYPEEDQNFSVSLTVNYAQATSSAVVPPHPVSFADDSWETIIGAIQSGNTDAYHVGDTKTVTLGNSLGTHTLRIANKSTPSECSTTGFSQTACGFVLEFADIITTHRMNPYTYGDANLDGSTVNGTGNKGGWEYSDMRAYLNSTTYANENTNYSTTGIYSSLPEVLRNAIINTTVVSGHGGYDDTNFTTTDKLYLLSTHEVWEDDDGNTSSGIDYYDTVYNNTRQLDYYVGLNVTTSSYGGAIKKIDGSISWWWWLRSISSGYGIFFHEVDNSGDWDSSIAVNSGGVSPAFRLG